MAGTLAIDLGSTTTVVAYQDGSGSPPELLDITPFSLLEPRVIPSLIWIDDVDNPRPLIGRQVVEAGLLEQGGPALHRDFKRWIGAATATLPAELAERRLSPEQSGRLLLEQIWSRLPAGLTPQRLVLTAPIDSYRGYRQWLLNATSSLTVAEIALVDEPTAAAIGAGLKPGNHVLVIDLGGGTTDLSLVALEGGEGRAAPIAQLLRFSGRNLDDSRQSLRTASVLGKAGLAVGGRDLDRWIAAELLERHGLSGSISASEPGLLQCCERLKCELSASNDAMTLWSASAGQPPQVLRFTRSDLNTLLQRQGLLALLDDLLEQVLASARAAGLDEEAIDAVLPVGGCSRIPLIRQWLTERLPQVPLRDQRPVEAVALGALQLTPGVAVKDVLERGVSLRCWDQRSGEHRWHPLFLPGQTWPSEEPLRLLLGCSEHDQQRLELVLGEPIQEQRNEVVFVDGLPVLRRQVAGNTPVQAWALQPDPLPLSPAGKPGQDRLELLFAINPQGELTVEGRDLLNEQPLPLRRLGQVR